MGAPPPKPPPGLADLLATAAPGIAAAVELLSDEAKEHREQALKFESERHELAKARAELARREAELHRQEDELTRMRKALQEQAALLARRTPGKAGRIQPYGEPAPQFAWPIWVHEPGPFRLVVPERITYRWCLAFFGAPNLVRAQVSQARQCQYRRIARMPGLLGDQLDKAGVAFHAIRYVAYAETYIEMNERCQKILNGERAPRRKPRDPEAKPNKKRGPGRPAHAPPVKPAPKNEAKKKTNRGEARPKATRGRGRPQPHAEQEQGAGAVIELASQLAAVNILSGKYDPEIAGADDITDEDDVIERAKQIVAALEINRARSGEQK